MPATTIWILQTTNGGRNGSFWMLPFFAGLTLVIVQQWRVVMVQCGGPQQYTRGSMSMLLNQNASSLSQQQEGLAATQDANLGMMDAINPYDFLSINLEKHHQQVHSHESEASVEDSREAEYMQLSVVKGFSIKMQVQILWPKSRIHN